jgi:hypothetical protein
MNRRLSIAAFLLLVIAPASNASAQLLAAKDGPIVYGHHHLNVSDMDAAKKFWVDALGGVLVIVGPEKREIIKFPNALMLLRAQSRLAGARGPPSTTSGSRSRTCVRSSIASKRAATAW